MVHSNGGRVIDTGDEERMETASMLSLFRAMVAARKVDELEKELVQRGEAFFHVSGAGHEGSAGIVPHLIEQDYLHVHYRSKAMMLARGYRIESFFLGLHSKDASHCRGRQMSAHVSDPSKNILSIPGPVGNSALQSVGVAAAVKDHPSHPIVVSGIGDGSTQQGEFLEACAEAARSRVPVLFVVEDNHWAISTETSGKTLYSAVDGQEPPREFHGVKIHHVDGRDVIAVYEAAAMLVAKMRDDRRPQLVVLEMERLSDHTNADDQTIYRAAEDIQRAAETGDPIAILERRLLAEGMDASTLEQIKTEIDAEVRAAEAKAFDAAEPEPVFTAKPSVPDELTSRARERRDEGDGPALAMRDAMREVLHHRLQTDPRVVLFGEDIEDPKGDVFGVTKGLSTAFPDRVLNSPLTESTIIGTSVGRALAGQRPVAFLQFADFLPLAFNQLTLDLATMWWRTDGGWTSPVIVLVPCGGFRPGLGPFHSHSLESVLAHTPGLDVFMPSTAADAAGMLNAAFASERPTVMLYPKACLNDPLTATTGDVAKHFVPIGRARKERAGHDITLVGWGNTLRLCRRTAEALEQAGVEAEIIDLRSISPWDEQMVLASAEKNGRLLVVHEDNHTCGLGSEILATVAEKSRGEVATRRVTRADTFIPCNFANQIQVLPSFKRVLEAAADLLDLELTWKPLEQSGEQHIFPLEAVGTGPSDEAVELVELFVKPGDKIAAGDAVAELEATKGVFELTSPVAGVLEEILAAEGDTVAVGEVMMKIRTVDAACRRKPITREQCGEPMLKRRRRESAPVVLSTISPPRGYEVGIAAVSTVKGSRLVTNDELLPAGAEMTAEDVVRRTGIESRCWVAEGEDALSMASRAATDALEREHLLVDDLDLVICTSTSPTVVTPSMACLVVDTLAASKSETSTQAYDINAACSGYLYALQAAYDFLQSVPKGRVMLVTAEVLSPLLDPHDFDTSIIFGDAASATIIYGEEHLDRTTARIYRPLVSAKSEDGSVLSVPLAGDGYIQMHGRRVFTEAVRLMLSSLTRACDQQGLDVSDLKMVVPHQANQRIIDAIAGRVDASVFSNIRSLGNTSSTSIPLCLQEVLPQLNIGERVGLCAFGGGFTYGAAILESISQKKPLVNAAA